ncbi:15532_t:CDS:2 [Dentiscutata heterogama]|uniref:15532_t:CDS:1 n=1 Tax=Dentiscutata heterogama TaxID=1316150 RepID=A0ACA9LX64_9GLOM|nr:15532_t:CDS:2 [Dentiscutata heterogama]
MSKTTHTKKETRVDDDGAVHTVTTTTVTYSGSHSKGFNSNINDFLADSNFDFNNEGFGKDFFSKIKRVSYEKPHEQPAHLPEEYTLYKKPTQEVQYLKSDCSGHKRALLIGINYIGTKFKLEGCINDVKNIKEFLINHFKFKESEIVVLTDEQHDQSRIPTRENILKEMKALVANAQPHDSGHGGQQIDTDGDEEDGYDETIMPLDFQTRGQIIDDEMHHILVDGLPAGCRLTVVFDSCHSGTVLDLPYVYSTHGKVKKPHIIQHAINAGIKYIQGDREDAKTVTAQALSEQKIRRKNLETKSSPADVIMFSGCKDEQTSADASGSGPATGAMSHALITTLRQDSHQTYHSLLNNIRDILRDKYSQKPQLSA